MKVVFEDNCLLVLDKPPGLVVTPTETQKEETLVDWLKDYFGHSGGRRPIESRMTDRMGIVHRLDKDTSGLILVAKTEGSFQNLQAQFKERTVKKEYIALVHGYITEAGKVDGPVGRNPLNREKFIVMDSRFRVWDNEGDWKEAVTEYTPLNQLEVKSEKLKEIFKDFNKIQMRKLEKMGYGKFTLLRCFPKTGRTHQIRVHLKHIGFPIVSDEKYAGRKIYRLDHRFCPRHFLHAAKIGFKHPVSGEWMELESELPEDLSKVLASLEQ